MADIALAYSIVRGSMSAGERTAFAQKMFNDDTAGYQDNCTNQLQQGVGSVATYKSGSTAVTGSGLADSPPEGESTFDSLGRWATISAVNSDSSLTLTGAPQYALGGNAATQTAGGRSSS